MRFTRSRRGVPSETGRRGAGAAIAIVTVLALALTGCAPSTTPHKSSGSKSSTYGSLPGFLPKDSLGSDRMLVGTQARPALTTEGDAVSQGPGGAVVTVSGPEVPGEGLPYQAEATTCTWTVSVRAGTHAVVLDPSDFSTIDHLGTSYYPTLVPGEPIPPSLLRPHETTTFELRAVMVVGEGLMRWAPDGRHIIAQWDFEVEND